MNDQINKKYEAVKAIAKIRGIKEFTDEQKQKIINLCEYELTPTEIINEVLDAPKERLERGIKAARAQGSKVLSTLSAILKPE
jgi:hypothetical protein